MDLGNMSAQEMLERIAQLDHSRCLLKEQNSEMRSWLDAADEDMATLRSENDSLRRQVKELEKLISDAQIVESEQTSSQPDYQDMEIRNEMKIQKLEKESVCLKEENKKLTAEMTNLQQLQEQDDLSLNKLKASLQMLESEMEVAQLGLQHRDEVIQQKYQELKHAEEMVEEYSSIIKNLRQNNQQLKDTLEAGQDEVSFAIAIDQLEAKEKSNSPVLSFAEELKLWASSAENVIPQTHDEPLSEDIPKTHCDPVDCQDSRSMNEEASNVKCSSASTSNTDERTLQVVHNAVSSKNHECSDLLMTVLVLGTLFLLFVLATLTSSVFTGSSELFSYVPFKSGMRFLLEPYFTVHFRGMPPI